MVGLAAQAALVGALLVGDRGYAVRYAEGKMQHVAHIRGITQQPCMLAWTAARNKDVGRVWLRVEGPAGAAQCLVVDLPQDVDRANLERRGILVELDYRSGALICGLHWEGAARECEVRVIPE